MTSDAPQALAHPALLDTVAEATERLRATVRELTDDDVPAPSLLPDWTRGHLLSHISRNADSLVNLLLWARTGIETPQYASPALRDADIEAGAPRPMAEQLADFEESATRWLRLAQAMTPESWNAHVRTRAGREIPGKEVLWMRLQEVEIHHVDLGLDYQPADWPSEFVARLLRESTLSLTKAAGPDAPTVEIHTTDTDFTALLGSGTPTHTVSGTSTAVLAWLVGRSEGADLTGELPALTAWR